MSGIFRDPTDGTRARVDDLLRRRRDELVTLPHVVRRVVVARTARIAASIAVCIGGVALLAAAASPELAEWLTDGLPGQRPAPLSTLLVATWILGIAAYAIARSVSEHRFAVKMSEYVLPGDDLNQDLERLSHEHPDEVAKHMAHRLEVKSASLPILAAAMVVPATLMYLFKAVHNLGWPSPNGFEAAIALHSTPLIAIAVLGLLTAIVMTRPAARVHRVCGIAGGFAAVAVFMALVSYVEWSREFTWALFAPGFIAGMIAVIVSRLSKERTRIAAVDPAAGSEIFTLGGSLKKLRAGVTAINRALTVDNARRVLRGAKTIATRRPSARAAVIAVAVAAAGAYAVMALVSGDPATAADVVNGDGIDMQSAPSADTTWQVSKSSGGEFDVDITFGDMYEIEIPTLAGIESIPDGWELVVTVRAYDTDFSDGDEPHALFVSPVLDSMVAPRELRSSVDFAVDNCDNMHIPLGLRIRPYGAEWKSGHEVKLTVEPRLRVASCPDPLLID